jgi:Family of unknown function (DUF5367)
MKSADVFLLLAAGIFIWVVGTIYFANQGRAIFETTGARYWTAFTLTPIVSAAFCVAILLWRQIAPAHWTTAMLLLAIPGMMGEAVVLSRLSVFMPRLHAASGGDMVRFSLLRMRLCLRLPK